MTANTQDYAAALGALPASVISLHAERLTPAHLDFLGLIYAEGHHELVPDAVVVHEGQPLLYLFDLTTRPASREEDITSALKRLALRSDAPYGAVIRPGSVQVHALSTARAELPPLLVIPELQPGLIARLAVGDVEVSDRGVTTHQLMLELLSAVTEQLIASRDLSPQEALALVGRALFLRFLADRKLIQLLRPFPGVARFEDCFATAENAAASCAWLDETFNGDLLELPLDGSATYFARLESHVHQGVEGSALSDLTAIIRGDRPVGDGAYQTQFSWGDLHFSYIPVGLLSQVYEEYAHRFDAEEAKKASVYYTPRHLAEYMVDHAFALLGENASARPRVRRWSVFARRISPVSAGALGALWSAAADG